MESWRSWISSIFSSWQFGYFLSLLAMGRRVAIIPDRTKNKSGEEDPAPNHDIVLKRTQANSMKQQTNVLTFERPLHQNDKLYQLTSVSFGGAGIYFWWELGCVQWLSEHVDLDRCPLFGASGGALAITLAACKVDINTTFNVAWKLMQDHKLLERPLGLAGVWGRLVAEWLDTLLPENAADICRHRVSIVVTTLPRLTLKSISDFDSKEDLIEAIMASVHIPFFLDGSLCKRLKGFHCIDGSFYEFFFGGVSQLLRQNGKALVFDYLQDEKLKASLFSSLFIKKPEEVMRMIQVGYDYAERLSKTEQFTKYVSEAVDVSCR